jgi:hypothetical protein
MRMRFILLPLVPLALAGCVSTAKTIVTAPFKVVGQAADWATTSQSEADRNRGRAIRKAEEKARKACKREGGTDYAREQCVRDRLRAQGVI